MSGGDCVGQVQQGLGTGIRKAAGALLGTLTSDTVVLRLPQPPAGDSDAEELGLGSPQFNDVLLTPALVQQVAGKVLVTVSAEIVEALLNARDGDAVEQAVRAASFALVNGRALQVSQVERRAVHGRAYLYRLVLVAPELA